ncbi:MAG: hypothetical protein ACK40X_03335 [Armatimonadota bacterium]
MESARGLSIGLSLALKSVEKQEIRWKGYVRKPVLDDIQQRPQTRLYTGAAVYNLPYLFVEPQDEGNEWVEVEVVLRVIGPVEKG